MTKFAKWFIVFFKEAVHDIYTAFKDFFVGLYYLFIGNPIKYFKDYLVASKGFAAGDWVMGIFSILVALTFYVVAIMAIYVFCRKYLRFVKKEKNKEALMREITRLSKRVMSLEDEKNAMLALSGNAPAVGERGFDASRRSKSKERFVKLIAVDELYNNEKLPTVMKPEDELTLRQLIDRFIAFAASQLKLYYNRHTVISFFAGLATSKTMILEGISGTGKTSLPYAMGIKMPTLFQFNLLGEIGQK